MDEKGDEEPTPQSNVTSWWGSFYDTAKQKLVETNEFLVRDIKEFTDTVKNDTSKLVADTAASMKDQLNINVNLDEASNATKMVTNSISGFLGKVAQHVAPIPPDDEENEDSTMYLGTSTGVKVMSPAEARLFSMQTSPATFCNEPDNLADFEIWKESFVLDEKKEELSLLMLDSKEVRSLYTKLVPEAVSHVNFWTRYFYKKQELEKAEERRARLVERAQIPDADLGWGDEDEYDVVDHPESSKVAEKVPSSSTLQVNASPSDSFDHKSIAAPAPEIIDVSRLPKPSEDSKKIDLNSQIEQATVSTPSEDLLSSLPDVVDSRPTSSPSPELVSIPVEEKAPKTPTHEPLATNQPSSEVQQNSSSTKEPSSGADSSDWEKEFDIDMTEDEVNDVLLEGDVDDDIEGWEEWE